MRHLIGVITGAHHRAAGCMSEAHGVGLLLEPFESIRRDVAFYCEVVRGGLQVLAERKHIDVVRAQILHDFDDFFVGLAEAYVL
jgi:hypothetical protein